MVYIVTSYNLGGNSGHINRGVFTSREEAETWAKQEATPHLGTKEWWGERKTWDDVFEIEDHELDNLLH